MKLGITIHHPKHYQGLEEKYMSNLTSPSGEASTVSSTIPNSTKKKRNIPGNPDPESEVMALSPKTLMATNRFVCEICSKGFQRDQNLQLHRRGHNLPWKLKQRPKDQVVVIRKKVYVCPEPTCVHHHPSRALGDLTGIKKHFSRKHGEKRWKCDKCSKKYAVHSDWKAHSKICGTREYKCDCGTIFSRRDSFITHRAFCDALAVDETSRGISANTMAASLRFHSNQQQVQQTKQLGTVLTPWLNCQGSTSFNSLSHLDYLGDQPEYPNHGGLPSPPLNFTVTAPHMSATALLQKAAQMGATRSTGRPQMAPHASHYSSSSAAANAADGFGLGLMDAPPRLLEDMMMNNNPLSSSTNPGFDGSFEDAFGGIIGRRTQGSNGGEGGGGGGCGDNDGMTRDFLGLRAFFPPGYL